MACYHPINAFQSKYVNPETGKHVIKFGNVQQDVIFDSLQYIGYEPIQLPCGKCIGCRLERSRQWALRCLHEASLYEKNCFITLTFDDKHLDPGNSLVKKDFVNFMKRLRDKYGSGIRFFHCGEYGTLRERPHHHACLFNFDFPDKELWSIRQGVSLYRSASLEELWHHQGFCTVGDVTFESAAYVARYILKKINGEMAREHYAVWDEDGSYLCQKEPEYITMSRRPGIAHDWFEKYSSDVFPHDYCVVKNGLKCKPPRYYDNLYDRQNPVNYVKIKLRRKEMATRSAENNTPTRLRVREQSQFLRAAKLLRTLD